jgi:hypothetical protein
VSLTPGQIAVLDLKTGTQKVVVRGGSHVQYVSSGHLVYGAGGALRAVPFELDRLEVHRWLVWVDRQGRETPIPAPLRAYQLLCAFPRRRHGTKGVPRR